MFHFLVNSKSEIFELIFDLAVDILGSGEITKICDGPSQKGWSEDYRDPGQGAIDAECGLFSWKAASGIKKTQEKSASRKDYH